MDRAPAAPPRAAALKARRRRAIGAAVGLAALALAAVFLSRLVAGIGLAELGRRVATAHRGWLLVGAGGVAFHYFCWSARWRIAVLAARVRASAGFLYMAILAAAAVNLATPFARVFGGILRARYLAHRDPERRGGPALYGVVLFDQIVHGAVMSAFTVAMLVAGAASASGLSPRVLTLAASGGAILAVLYAIAHRRGFRPVRHLSNRWLVRVGQEAWIELSALVGKPRIVLSALATGVVAVLATALAQAMVFLAVGVEPPFWAILAAVTLGTAAGAASGSPGGVGTTEAAMIAIYLGAGVPRPEAAAATLLYRGLLYAVVLGLGLPSAAILEAQIAREPDEEP